MVIAITEVKRCCLNEGVGRNLRKRFKGTINYLCVFLFCSAYFRVWSQRGWACSSLSFNIKAIVVKARSKVQQAVVAPKNFYRCCLALPDGSSILLYFIRFLLHWWRGVPETASSPIRAQRHYWSHSLLTAVLQSVSGDLLSAKTVSSPTYPLFLVYSTYWSAAFELVQIITCFSQKLL